MNIGTSGVNIKINSKNMERLYDSPPQNTESKENKIEKNQIKEGADFAFKQTPELADIGTMEQYSEYLDTVFPESKAKDIVYHRTVKKFDVFDKTKTKKINGYRFYFSPINTGRYGQYVMQAILNIKNLAEPYNDNFINDVNKEHPEYTEGKSKYFYLPAQIYVNANKYGYDGVYAFEGGNDDEYSVYEPEQINVLGSEWDMENFKKFVANENKT
ncbi:MAG: hypothetical protein WC523_03220 [Patescibacteria group bacterium]